MSVTTDADGYFGAAVSGVTPGDFVTVRVTAPAATADSPCLASSGDNDFWPKALALAGRRRPGLHRLARQGALVQVRRHAGPAHRGRALGPSCRLRPRRLQGHRPGVRQPAHPGDAADLTKLSAEYAPSVFSPSVFCRRSSRRRCSALTPTRRRCSRRPSSARASSAPRCSRRRCSRPRSSARACSARPCSRPSRLLALACSRPRSSRRRSSARACSARTEIAQAFSSAQTRSIVGVSATPGTGDESVVVNTWNNTGSFYVRVASRSGAFDTGSQFTVTVTKGATTCAGVTDTTLTPRAGVNRRPGSQTVILTDSSKSRSARRSRTAAHSGPSSRPSPRRPEIDGVVVDVASDARVVALEAAGATTTPPARSRRTSSPRRSRASSTRTAPRTPAPVRRARRQRRRDPVLPLPRPEPARPGVRLRPAGRERLALRGEPAARLRAQPGRLRRRDADLTAHERLPGAGPRGRPARRDAGRDRRAARCLHRGRRRRRADARRS